MRRVAVAGLLGLLTVAACGGPSTLSPHPGEPWTGPDDRVVPATQLALYAIDCDGRESAGFLEVLWPLDPVPGVEPELRLYVRDPRNVMPTTRLLAPYDAASALPRDARFTGYRSATFQLWAGADEPIYLYLVEGRRVEALPRALDDAMPCP
jgi:hypothetical protein